MKKITLFLLTLILSIPTVLSMEFSEKPYFTFTNKSTYDFCYNNPEWSRSDICDLRIRISLTPPNPDRMASLEWIKRHCDVITKAPLPKILNTSSDPIEITSPYAFSSWTDCITVYTTCSGTVRETGEKRNGFLAVSTLPISYQVVRNVDVAFKGMDPSNGPIFEYTVNNSSDKIIGKDKTERYELIIKN